MAVTNFHFPDSSHLLSIQAKISDEVLILKIGARTYSIRLNEIDAIGFSTKNTGRIRNSDPAELGEGILIIKYLEKGKKKAGYVPCNGDNLQTRKFLVALLGALPEKFIGEGSKKELLAEMGLSYAGRVIIPMIISGVVVALLLLAWFLLGAHFNDTL